MNVIIDEVISRVHAIDGQSALAPETMRTIVEAVLVAVRADHDHEQQVQRERAGGSESRGNMP